MFDTVINLPPDPDIGDEESIGDDGLTTQLNVADGGTVGENFTARSGSEVNISGGVVGTFAFSFREIFTAESGSEVNISGGTVLDDFIAESGSEVNISGGTVSKLDANDGSEVNISGGTLERRFDANSGSVVNISGGNMFLDANSGSQVNISGGAVGRPFVAFGGSDVALVGGEFRLNDAAFTDSTISLSPGDVFTGTLADGSAFVFANYGPFSFFLPQFQDHLTNVSLTPGTPPALDLTPMVIDTVFPNRPSGLRAGQSLTLRAGGELDGSFEAVSATLNIEGGALGPFAGAAYSEVNIRGGTVGDNFQAFDGSFVNISGGDVGRRFIARAGSEVNVSGGTVGTFFMAESGSVINISGGSMGGSSFAESGSEVNITGGIVSSFETDSLLNISGGDVGGFTAQPGSIVNINGGAVGSFAANPGSEVYISGGTFGSFIRVSSNSEVNLLGSEFLLDGEPLANLVPGEAFTILDRDVTLSGRLADESTFSFDLSLPPNQSGSGLPFVGQGATLTVTLGDTFPGTPPFLLGDVDQSGAVDFLDIGPFISLLSNGEFQDEADINHSGVVDFLDIGPFIGLLSS